MDLEQLRFLKQDAFNYSSLFLAFYTDLHENICMGTNINLSTVDGLKSLGDPTLFNRLIELFIETGGQQIAHLQVFGREKNWAKVSSEAHSLKSSALSLGADDLGQICFKLEDKTVALAEKEQLIPLLQPEFERVVAELQKLRDSE